MGASGKHRRRLSRARTLAMLAAAAGTEASYIGPGPTMWNRPHEAWMAAGVLFILPALTEGEHPEVLSAIERRRRASITGRCDCGARRRLTGGPQPHLCFEHEFDCPAGDERLAELFERYGVAS
jgi:hypothetical protein